VERLNWRAYEELGDSAKSRAKVGAWARLPGSERVATFDTPEDAEADCRRREEEARKGRSPFACGTALCYQTSLDEGRLRDWLLDAGLEPPEAGTPWRQWWDEAEPNMTEVQRSRVWEALDKVRFFRVAEAPSRVMFMVAAPYWHYNDEYHYTKPDGLTPYKAFRTREAAEAERERMEDGARDVMEMHPFQINGLGDWSAVSSLSQDEAAERVKALGLQPPVVAPHPYSEGKEMRDWETWWDEVEMTPSQCNGVWDLLDKVRFWEVIEVEVPG
jgi:hypothetical protein